MTAACTARFRSEFSSSVFSACTIAGAYLTFLGSTVHWAESFVCDMMSK